MNLQTPKSAFCLLCAVSGTGCLLDSALTYQPVCVTALGLLGKTSITHHYPHQPFSPPPASLAPVPHYHLHCTTSTFQNNKISVGFKQENERPIFNGSFFSGTLCHFCILSTKVFFQVFVQMQKCLEIRYLRRTVRSTHSHSCYLTIICAIDQCFSSYFKPLIFFSEKKKSLANIYFILSF